MLDMSVNSYVCESTVLPKDNNSVDSYLSESCKMIKDNDIKTNVHLLHLPVNDKSKKTNIYVCRGQYVYDNKSNVGCTKLSAPNSTDKKFENIAFQIASIDDALNLHSGASLSNTSVSL